MTGRDGELRRTLSRLLGLPDKPCVFSEDFQTGGDFDLSDHPATYLVPQGKGPFPAVIYCHAHGGQYELGRRELTEGAPWLVAPYADALLAAGFCVLCLDMPGFGDRIQEGSESALAKAGLWRGQPLFGRMIAEQWSAFRWLGSRNEVDATRIVALGTSMGGALAMWLAALEPRVAACVQLCMLADIEPLIGSGTHDRHGHYLTVPGLLKYCDTGDIAGLIAPRPQFVGHGEHDHLTPSPAREAALRRVRGAYSRSSALRTFLDPVSGHGETPAMRHAVMDFLAALPSQTKQEKVNS